MVQQIQTSVPSLSGNMPQMKTSVRAINPAFLQEIKDSHADLWTLLHQVRSLIHSEASDGSNRELIHGFVRQLNELRDLLALQFSLEESYGYMMATNACGNASGFQVDVRIAQAIEQHRRLYLAITDLCDRAEDMQYRGVLIQNTRHLFHQTNEFDRQLRQHELLESELIELAYFDRKR